MKLKDFKLRQNKQRPDFCYGYEKNDGDRKYMIFTMNGGKTFLASVEEPRLDGRWYTEFSEHHKSIDECLTAFDSFNIDLEKAK